MSNFNQLWESFLYDGEQLDEGSNLEEPKLSADSVNKPLEDPAEKDVTSLRALNQEYRNVSRIIAKLKKAGEEDSDKYKRLSVYAAKVANRFKIKKQLAKEKLAKEKAKDLLLKKIAASAKTDADKAALLKKFSLGETDVRRRRASEIVNEEEDNPWAICTASVGRDEDDKEKYENCVMGVKKEEGLDEAELEEKKKHKKRRKRKRRAYGGGYMFDTDGDGGGDGGGGE